MRLDHDREANAIYVYLRDLPYYAYNKLLDERRIIDYAEDHHPIGIELLNVSHGMSVRDLPEQAAVERLLEEYHIKVLT
jgi:uncharacterized protein YuzE